MSDSATNTATNTLPETTGETRAEAVTVDQGGEGVTADPPPYFHNIDSPPSEISAMPISEADFCRLSGLNRGLVRSFREANFTEGVNWIRKPMAITLLPFAVEQLCEAYDVSLADVQPPPESPVVELRAAKKCAPANRGILLCEPPEDYHGPDRVVRVVVKTNEKFIPGMKVPAIWRGPALDLWEFAGKRLPRSRGRY